ncbi:MAG: hypothetical protein ACI8RZ_003255 [Myxococcota bacterium]|jgi:hypothetical protein
MSWRHFPRKPSVAERRAQAKRDLRRLQKKGQKPSPILLDGRRSIVGTFWGKAWCDNVKSYRDLAYRLERGRSYVRHNQVIDLNITPGMIHAQVSGSEIYQSQITIKTLSTARWQALTAHAAGQIDSMVSLLQGKLSQDVMKTFCAQDTGLFPSSKEISFSCSCPDHASVCKHVAAVMYGIGVRLDESPELLFRLRDVDESELLQTAAQAEFAGVPGAEAFGDDDLSALFGIELDLSEAAPTLEPAVSSVPTAAATSGLLHEALLVSLIAILMGAESWAEVDAFANDNRDALLGLLPLEDATTLPSLASAHALAGVLDTERLTRWRQALLNTASQRYRPDNRLRRGLEAALAIIPRLSLTTAGGRIQLDKSLSKLLPLLKGDHVAGVIIGAGDADLASAVASEGGTYFARISGPLEEELTLFFNDASALEFEDIDHVMVEADERRLTWVDWVDWVPGAEQWSGLSGLIMLEEGEHRAFYLSNGRIELTEGALGILRLQETGLWLVPYPTGSTAPLPESLRSLAERLLLKAGHRDRRAQKRWRKEAADNHRMLLRVLGS